MGFLDSLKTFAQDVHTIAQAQGNPSSRGGPMQPSNSSGGSGGISPYPINDSATVILDSNGNGKATLTPGQVSPGGGVGVARNSGYSWDVTGTYVNVSTDVNQATAVTYISYGIQSTNAEDAVGNTALGSTGDTGTFNAHLLPGDWITTIWTGGDPGSIATMKITGTVNPPGV
jgi:hypothetical protein